MEKPACFLLTGRVSQDTIPFVCRMRVIYQAGNCFKNEIGI